MRKKKLDTVARMTPEQASLLRKLAFDAYEPEAFSSGLTRTEAEQHQRAAGETQTDEQPHTQ
jgi:hypothetical protein